MMNPYDIAIEPLDEQAMQSARARQDSLAKPPHSLGVLEDISVRFAGITGNVFNEAKKRRILIFSADNGVVEEGVASAPQSVTLAQTINFVRGLTAVATLARHYNKELRVYEVAIMAKCSNRGGMKKKMTMGPPNRAK